MNVKFKMPKFSRYLMDKTWQKELGLTIIGTTLSIILTFGTAQYFEHKQKVANGRLMAMMVIHDMVNTIEEMRQFARDDVECSKMTREMMDNIDRLDSFDYNSLLFTEAYICNTVNLDWQYLLDEASEKIFLSSQESWKNINNTTFIDAVQRFYIMRHEIYDMLNTSWLFKKPISDSEYHKILLDFDGRTPSKEELLKVMLARKEVEVFIDHESERLWALNLYKGALEKICDKCKFTMGINDQDMAEYIKECQLNGKKVKESDLVGLWIISQGDEENNTYEFFADHKFVKLIKILEPRPFYNGRYKIQIKRCGSWELQDDSLFMEYDTNAGVEFDRSDVKAKPGMEEETKLFLDDYEKDLEQQKMAIASQPPVKNHYAAYIDRTGHMIELTWTKLDAEGDEVKKAHYLTRPKD